MDSEEPQLDLPSGYLPSQFGPGDPILVLGLPDLTLADLSLARRSVVRRRLRANCPVAFDPHRRVVYFSDGSLNALDLDLRTYREISRPPKFAVDPAAEARATVSLSSQARRALKTAFVDLLVVSGSGDDMITICISPDAKSRVVRIDADGAIRGTWECGWSGGCSACHELGWICFPGHAEGATVFDLDGQKLFGRATGIAGAYRRFEQSAINCVTGHIALANSATEGPLAVWEPAEDRLVVVDELGGLPAWSEDGKHLWYLKGGHELWTAESGIWNPHPLVRLAGRPWDDDRRFWSKGSAGRPPCVSRNGQFLYCQLTLRLEGRLQSDAYVVAFTERLVQRVPNVYHHWATWLL